MEQKRFLLAMILSGLVIFIWQIFFLPPPEEYVDDIDDDAVEQVAQEDDQADQEASASVDDAPDDVDPSEAQALEAPSEAQAEAPTIEARRDLIRSGEMVVELSNRGAVVVDTRVTSPEQYARPESQLMRSFEEDAPDLPFSMNFEDGNIDVDPDQLFELVEQESVRAADGKTFKKIVYRHVHPAGHYSVDKIYSLDTGRRYALQLEVEVKNLLDDDGVRLASRPILNIIGRDDPDKESNFFDFRPDVLEGVCHTTDGTEREVFDPEDPPESFSEHSVMWAGAHTRYFMMAAVPADPAEACGFEPAGRDYLRTTIKPASFNISPGDSWSTSFMLYMGPKHFDILRDNGYELQEAVDYGLFTILARPLRWALVRLYDITLNWGLAIILLTFIIKTVTWPITGKAYTNAERMKQIQPVIKEIREKYENDQQRMTEETMKAFRENNVSPLGCLPLLLQMPILYGLFVMIYNSVELYHASFLWYADLSAPDPWFILPIVMGAVMFVQQKITMSTAATTNPQMMIVMKVMPIAFTAFMLFLPAGLVLYYLLNLLMGLGQQFWIKRKFRLAEEAGESI